MISYPEQQLLIKNAIDALLLNGIPLSAIKFYLNDISPRPDISNSKTFFYAVAKGHVPGIYESWDDAKEQLIGFKGVKHRKFKTREEAELFLIA